MKISRRQVLKAMGLAGVSALTACGSKPAASTPAASTPAASTPAVAPAAYVAPKAPRTGVFEPFGAEFFNNGGFNVPGITFQPSRPDTNGTHFEPVEIFKNVYFIGDTWVCCILFQLDNGDIVMWDALTTKADMEELVFPDMEKLGLDPAKIKTVFISHGHGDHYGCSGNLQEMYGTEVYFCEDDQALIDSSKENRIKQGETVPTATGYLKDGDVIQTGNITWTFVHTPGHTPGSMSFIVDVVDFDGVPHKMSCWGGTSAPRDAEGTKTYLNSVLAFKDRCAAEGVDVFLSMHPFVDYSVELTTNIRETGKSDALVKTPEEIEFFMQGLYVYASGKGKLAQDGINEFTNEGYSPRVLSWPYLIQIPEYDTGIASIFKDEAIDAQILDNVYLIGNGTDATLVFNTKDGIVLVDAMTSNDDFTKVVLPAMQGHGLDPAKIKAVYLTHGQSDKYGFAAYVKETYGAEIYMSDADKPTAEGTYADAVAAGKTTAVPETKNLPEGPVTHGEYTFNWYSTPGHTPGTMSFTVNVTLDGKEHTAVLWGGGEFDYAKEALQDYLDSIEKFILVAETADADVMLATHPYFNYSVEKIHDMAAGDKAAFIMDDQYTTVKFALQCIQIAAKYKLEYYSV